MRLLPPGLLATLPALLLGGCAVLQGPTAAPEVPQKLRPAADERLVSTVVPYADGIAMAVVK